LQMRILVIVLSSNLRIGFIFSCYAKFIILMFPQLMIREHWTILSHMYALNQENAPEDCPCPREISKTAPTRFGCPHSKTN
jgi:hypothetical protein